MKQVLENSTPDVMSLSQQSKCNMTTLKRSSLPAILLIGAAVGLGLYYVLSPSYVVTEQELHWIRRVQEINDKHSWTSKNCPKLMSLLIELCPCIANINPHQSVDDIEDSFVECVSSCISDDSNSTAAFDDYKGDYDAADYVEDKDAGAKPTAVVIGKKEETKKATGNGRRRR